MTKDAPLYLIHIAATHWICVMSHVMRDSFMYILNTANTRIPQTKQTMLNPDGSELHNPRAQAPGAAYNIFTSEHSLEDKAFFQYNGACSDILRVIIGTTVCR